MKFISQGSIGRSRRQLDEWLGAALRLVMGSALFAGFALPLSAQITIRQWNASSSTAWATANNWTAANVPNTNTEIAAFSSTWANTTTPTIAATSTTIGGLLVQSTVPNTNINLTGTTGVLTINAGAIGGTAGAGGVGIDNQSTYAETISARMAISNSQTWQASNAASGSLTFSNATAAIALGANTLTLSPVNAVNAISVSGPISGTGNLIVTGAGNVTLSGTNTYTGNSTLTSGTVIATNTRALGATTAPLVLNGGTLDLAISSSISAYNTKLTADSTVTSDRATAGAGITHTLGTLSIGAQTLNVNAGGNVTSGTAGLAFGATTLTGNATFDVGTGAQLQLGALAGGGVARVITKADVGTLIFGANATSVTAGSSLLVNGGIAQVNTATALGSGVVNVTVNSTAPSGTAAFNLNNVSQTIGTLTFGGAAAGASAVNSVATGTGTLTLNGNLAYVATNGPGNATLSGNLALGANRVFTIGDSANSTKELAVSAVVSGSGFGIDKQGAGTLELSGANTYNGVTTVTAGTLRAITSTAALGGGTLTLAGGNLELADNTGLNFARNTTVNTTSTVTSDRLSGTGNITNTLGTLSIGAQTLNVNAGAVITANGGTAGLTFGATTLTASGATFAPATGTLLTLGAVSGAGNNFTVNGAGDTTITGVIGTTSGTVTKAGAGTLVLGGVNTQTGTTTLSAGTLTVNSGATLSGATAPLVVNAGTLNLNNTAQTVASLNGSGGTINLGSGHIFTVNDTGSDSFAGTFGSSGSLVKSGTGTLTLSGASTYTGNTTVSAGVLNIQNADALGNASNTSTTTVANGATLQMANNITTTNAGTLVLNGTGTGSGALQSVSGDNRWNSNTTIGSNTSIFSSTAGNTLSIGNAAYGTSLFQMGSNTVTIDGPGNVWFDANVGVSGNTGGFIKNGTGKVTFFGSDTYYTGATTVNAGSLDLVVGAFTGGFNAINGALTIGTGPANPALAGTVSVNIASNSYANQISSNSAVTINSDGVLNVGASTSLGTLTLNGGQVITSSGQTVTPSGDITSNANSAHLTSQILGGNLTQTTGNINVARDSTLASDLTISSAIGGTSNLNKTGAGILTLSGVNTYTGGTTVGGGTLQLSGGGTLGSTSAALTVNTGGTLDLNGTTQGVGNLTGTAGTILNNATGTNVTFTIGNGNATGSNYQGVIADHTAGTGTVALTKTGTGTMMLSGNSTYSGDTTVSAGTLAAASNSALGAATGNVTVSSGGTLALGGGTTITKTGLLTLTGTGAAGANGALQAAGGTGTTSQFSGNLTLAGNTTIGAANNLLIVGEGSTFTNTINLGSNTLTLNTTAAVDGSTPTPTFVPGGYTLDKAQIMVNSAISGTGGLIKTGPGTAMLTPANVNGSTFTGDTVITGGKLIVDGPINKPGIASNNIYVGNASSPGAANSVVLQMGQLATSPADSNMVGVWNNTTDSSASNLTIYADGVFNMNNASNGFTSLTLTGGHVNGNGITPLITLGNGGVTTNVLTTNASNQTAIIEGGRLGLATFGNSNFTVAAGTAPGGVDLRIDDILQQGSLFTGYTDTNTSLTKLGAGKLVLTASNTYHGVTDVSAGILNIQNNAALGAVAPSLSNTANGTIVRSGAQLQLEKAAGLTIGSETLTLNGTGISGDGALRNVAGNNTYNGYVYLGSDSRINADSGTTLTIANTNGVNAAIMNGTGAGMNLTVGGAGNTTVNGGISSFVNNVTKDGTGTLTLAGYNGYAGATAVSQGIVKVTNSNGLSGTGATVTSGAALQFAQNASAANISVVSVPSTLNGTGISNGGAIENLNGSNSYAGAITLASAARINADAGSNLTLGGGITSSNIGLTVGGSGNTTVSGNINLGTSGTLTKDGSGTATLSGGTTAIGNLTMSAGTLNVSSASATTGTVTVNAGTATFSGNATNTGAVTVNTGTVNFNGTNATTGQVHLLGGATSTIAVGSGATLTTNEFNSSANTILSIASGGTVIANYNSGNTVFSGQITGAGTFKALGTAQVTFNTSIADTSLTMFLGGTSIGTMANALTFTITGATTLQFGTLHITGDTILDFGNSSASVLNSASLIIDAGVKVSVINWISLTDAWYATSSFVQQGGPAAVLYTNGNTPLPSPSVAPENQITFSGFSAANTAWVTPTAGNYFDHEIRPVPEPATYGVILLSGCLALLGLRRFRRPTTGRR